LKEVGVSPSKKSQDIIQASLVFKGCGKWDRRYHNKDNWHKALNICKAIKYKNHDN